MLDGTVNMTIGSYAINRERAQIMSHTKSYMQNGFIFAFVQSTTPSTPMTRLMAPFQNDVWMSIAILLSFSTFTILLSKRLTTRQRHFVIGGRMNRTPIVNMLSVFIGNVISNPQMAHGQYFGVFARTLATLWIFFWLVVRNSYQGSLFQFFQSQQIISSFDTVEKVRTSNVRIDVINTAVLLIPEEFDDDRECAFQMNNSIKEF